MIDFFTGDPSTLYWHNYREYLFSRDHVFVTRVNTPLKNGLLRRFYRVCQRAGIEDACRNGSVDIHSLRMTYTTMAIGNGADPKSVQDILGHSTLALTMSTYAKATNSGKRHATAAIPFATMSDSEHVIPMQNVCAAHATDSDSPQVPTRQRLA